MSYCRWSSDFYECDVYVYESIYNCWTIHVAKNRLKEKMPESIKSIPIDTTEGFVKRHSKEMEWLDKHGDGERLDLSKISSHAGKIYNIETPLECAKLLIQIRNSGLNVPQYVIDELQREAEGND